MTTWETIMLFITYMAAGLIAWLLVIIVLVAFWATVVNRIKKR